MARGGREDSRGTGEKDEQEETCEEVVYEGK